MAVTIVPAVLPKTFMELEEGLSAVRGVAKQVQVDVVADVFGAQEALPWWEEFDFEFDLFIEPAPFVERAIELGASRIVVHERFATAKKALDILQERRGGAFGVAVGLGLRSHDTPDVLARYEGLYDYVQIMGIDHEGVQGEPGDPHGKDMELVRAIRAAYPELVIQVDGAVGPRVREFAQAGANTLVVGSTIVKAENPKETYTRLHGRAN
jgi:pentose-5-phosphate-3-epimerase